MSKKIIYILKNLSYTISSNLINMFVSILIVLVIPKVIGVEEYGFWQLFVFYSSYVTFLHLGWTDGIYLRYSGKEYSDLDKKMFHSEFLLFLLFQLMMSFGVYIYAIAISEEPKIFIFKMISIFTILINLRYFNLHTLQATSKFKEYSHIIIFDRIIYLILVIFVLILGKRDYSYFIYSELLAKLLSLFYSIYLCRDYTMLKSFSLDRVFKEIKFNIVAGSKLMFSNTASMLILGVTRFGIEKNWNVETFGKVSLTLNISNFIMIFINAVGMVLFPMLKKISKEKSFKVYVSIRDLLMIVLFFTMALFYPLQWFMSAWLPQYLDSLKFMALVFPMCIYEGKISLLINTYLKSLRKEGLMLKINLVSLIVSGIVSFFTTYILKDLTLAVMSIVIVLAFRCILAEVILTKLIGINVVRDIIIETIFVFLFMFFNWNFNISFSFMLYILILFCYLIFKRKEIVYSKKALINLLK